MEGKSRMHALSDVIRPFEEQGDIVAWYMKVKLVAELQHITELTKLIPLYFEGDALALYLEMKERIQMDYEVIVDVNQGFYRWAFIANGKLTKIKWTGESVNADVSNIR